MRTPLLVTAIVLLALPTIGRATQPLAWKLNERDRFYAEIVSTTFWHGTEDGKSKTIQGTTTEMLRFDVVDRLPDGGFLLDVCLESVRYSNVDVGETLFLDMQGIVLRVRVDADMKVEYVLGVEEIRRRLPQDDPRDWDPRDYEETVTGWLELVLVPLPNCTTATGKKWQRSRSFHWSDAEACSTATYIDDGDVLQDGHSLRRVRFDWKWDVAPGQGLVLKEQQTAGFALFDAKAGRLVTAEYESHRVIENTRANADKEGGRDNERRKQTHIRLLDRNPLLPPRKPSVAPRVVGKPIGNTIDMPFVAVPAGKFLMGSRDDEPGRLFTERQHEVEIQNPFYIGATTVTVGQFRQFVEATGYKTTAETNGIGGGGWDQNLGVHIDRRFTWKNPGYPQTDRHPVVLVTWDDARAFCAWLSKKENRVYRLPTDAEWEYACRADSTTRFHFGDDEKRLVEYANVADAQLKNLGVTVVALDADDGHAFPAPVGSYLPNAWGLYDMHGNVEQWCENVFDLWPSNLGGKADPEVKMIRGGAWMTEPNIARSAAPAGVMRSRPSIGVGFRVLCENPNQ